MEKRIPLRYYDHEHTNENWLSPSDLDLYSISAKLSPKGRYIIYSGGSSGGVIETSANKVLEVDKSCFAKTPQETSPEAYFYNQTVDPFIEGPYKTLTSLVWDKEDSVTFKQTFCSGGGCSEEGVINVHLDENRVWCDIKVEYKSLDLE